MRLVPLLMLTLLLIGFAARPSVAAALSCGEVLLHPIAIASVADQETELSEAVPHAPHMTVTHCVSLGILPSGWLAAPQSIGAIPIQRSRATMPLDRAYGILRPPQA